MPRLARWILLALCLVPLAAATHQGPDDRNPIHLNVLVYHPYPDENDDPWGVPARSVNGTERDWMAATYGAFFYPTAVFDGLLRFDESTQGEGGGAYQETFAAYEGAYLDRIERDAPASILVEGLVDGRELIANVTIRPESTITSTDLVVRIVYFEDDVAFNGGSGILNHRFVVREEEQTFLEGLGPQGIQIEEHFVLPDAVDAKNVGVVVALQNFDEASPSFAWKEVLQSTTWLARTGGTTLQSARGVLLELYSATWCTACVVGDTVADELANTYGVASTRVQDRDFEYLRPGDWWKVGVAAIGAVAFVSWVRRQRPPEAKP